MAHVFLSYSSKHREETEKLAKYLDESGLDVWWDKELHARRDFDWQISEELRKAGCVVVLWTEGAVLSEWVLKEATYARDRDMLVCAKADELPAGKIPDDFRKRDAHRLDAERDLILRDVLAVWEGRLLLEDKRAVLPEPNARTPTMLLQAKFGLVPFTGSDAAREGMLDWTLARGAYGSSAKREAGRLVHGPGGLGKTRLLIEVAEALRAYGWSAGFLARPGTGDQPGDTADIRSRRRERQTKALSHLIRGANDKGLLLIMDYAEGREPEIRSIAYAIRTRPKGDTRPIRLVLLSRGAGDWWTRLAEDDQVVCTLFGGHLLDVVPLGGIASGRDRLDLFLAAVKAFTPRLAEMGYAVPPDGEATRLLTEQLKPVETNEGYAPGEGYDRPFAIEMKALLYVAAMAPGANEPGVHKLLANILGLERDHWPKLVPLRDETGSVVAARVSDIERAVGQITAVQGVEGRPAAEALFMADRFYEGQRQSRASVREVTENVRKIYGRGEVIAQLEPDLIGEHHLGLVGDEELLDGCLAWIATEADTAKREERYRDLVTLLQRATRAEHGPDGSARAIRLLDYLIKNYCETLARSLIQVASNTPGGLISRLHALLQELPVSDVAALDMVLPLSTISLADLAANVSRIRANDAWTKMLKMTSEEAHSDHEIATMQSNTALLLANLSQRLVHVGRAKESINEIAKSTTLLKRLVDLNPGRFDLQFAKAWLCASHCHASSGEFAESFACAKIASDALAKHSNSSQNASIQRELALCYQNKGAALFKIGRIEDAVLEMEAAEKIVRHLCETKEESTSTLAHILNNIAGGRGKLEHYETAVSAAEEATALYRSLVESEADAVLPDLAICLNNYAACLSGLGREAQALAVAEESAGILRSLKARRPDAYVGALASNLMIFGNRHSKLGDHDAALAFAMEAADLLRQRRLGNPREFSGELVQCLTNTLSELDKMDRGADAIALAVERIGLLEQLASENPDEFEPKLIACKMDLAGRYGALGNFEDELAARIDAMEKAKRAASKNHEKYLELVGWALTSLAASYAQQGNRQKDAEVTLEAIAVCRRLCELKGGRYIPALAANLNARALYLLEREDSENALQCSSEAVGSYRKFDFNEDAVEQVKFAACLNTYCQSLTTHGEHATAAEAAKEALLVLRKHLDEPRAHSLVEGVVRSYLQACRQSGAGVDWTLLKNVGVSQPQ